MEGAGNVRRETGVEYDPRTRERAGAVATHVIIILEKNDRQNVGIKPDPRDAHGTSSRLRDLFCQPLRLQIDGRSHHVSCIQYLARLPPPICKSIDLLIRSYHRRAL